MTTLRYADSADEAGITVARILHHARDAHAADDWTDR